MKKSSINNGLFLGIALVICSYVLYVANSSMFITAKSSVCFLVFILIMIKSGLEARRSEGGLINFKSAFISMFVTGAIGYLLLTISDFILFNFIDPGLQDMQKELTIEAMEKMSSMIGGDEMETAMEKEMEKLEDQNLASPGRMVLNYLGTLLFPVALCSAIAALVIKRKGPKDHLGDQARDDDKDQGRYIVKP